jgi:hypothetical protein
MPGFCCCTSKERAFKTATPDPCIQAFLLTEKLRSSTLHASPYFLAMSQQSSCTAQGVFLGFLISSWWEKSELATEVELSGMSIVVSPLAAVSSRLHAPASIIIPLLPCSQQASMKNLTISPLFCVAQDQLGSRAS